MGAKKKYLAPAIGIVIALSGWVITSAVMGEYRRFFPWPWEVASHLAWQLSNGTVWLDIGLTSARTVFAFCVGVVLGGPLGLLLGLNPRVYEAAQVPIDFIRSVPVTALFPIATLFFGVGDSAKLACVVLGCALIVLVHAAGAVRNLPYVYAFTASVLSLNRWDAFWRVTLPAALPEIANGLRVAASISLILVVVFEMFVGSDRGLGLRLFDDQQLFRIHDMYGTIFLIGSIGYIANMGLSFLHTRIIHWSNK